MAPERLLAWRESRVGFIVISLAFIAFVTGMALIITAFIGGELRPPLSSKFFGIGPPVIEHPPETHRLRKALVGVGMVGLAIALFAAGS
jgi:hypothetical protein